MKNKNKININKKLPINIIHAIQFLRYIDAKNPGQNHIVPVRIQKACEKLTENNYLEKISLGIYKLNNNFSDLFEFLTNEEYTIGYNYRKLQ